MKLTEPERAELHRLVADGKYRSVSEAIREGLGMLFAAQGVDGKRAELMKSHRLMHPARQGKVRINPDNRPDGSRPGRPDPEAAVDGSR